MISIPRPFDVFTFGTTFPEQVIRPALLAYSLSDAAHVLESHGVHKREADGDCTPFAVIPVQACAAVPEGEVWMVQDGKMLGRLKVRQ